MARTENAILLGVVLVIIGFAIMYDNLKFYQLYLTVLGVGGLIILGGVSRLKNINKYQKNYKDALSRKNKKDALYWGRLYYRARRNSGKLTLYDEQAISNDINFHCDTYKTFYKKGR